MKQILKYLKEYKKECICAPLFKLLEASFELIVPLVMAAIIDNGITASDKPYIWKMGGVLVLLAAVGLVSSVTAQYFAAKAAVGFPQSFAIYCLKDRVTVILKDGYSGHIDTYHEDDKRYKPGAVRSQSGASTLPSLAIYCIRSYGDGFYSKCKSGNGFVVTIPLLSIVVFSVMVASLPLYKRCRALLTQCFHIPGRI